MVEAAGRLLWNRVRCDDRQFELTWTRPSTVPVSRPNTTFQCSNWPDLVGITCKSFLGLKRELFPEFSAVAVQGSIPSKLDYQIKLRSHAKLSTVTVGYGP